MKTVRFLFMACFLAISSAMSAQVITYDFTTPGEDGTIYGQKLPTGTSDGKITYIVGTPMKNDICTITITDDKNSTTKSFLGYYDAEDKCFLTLYSNNKLTIEAERAISKIEFEFFLYNLDGWTSNVGALSSASWEGSSKSVEIYNGSSIPRIYSITITLESSDTYTEVASAADLAKVDDDTNVVFTSETTFFGQSADGKYVLAKSGEDMMYFVGESALPTAAKYDIISSDIKGKSTTINRIPAIVVENGYSTSNSLQPVELSLDALDLRYIGKLVAFNNVTIVSNEGELQIPSTSNPVTINNLFLNEVNATGSNQRADVVGVLAATDKNFVIHPISIVEKIYSGTEEAMMPDAEVSVRNGNIIISGEWNRADVYSIDGKLIAHNKREVSAGKGIYMVVVDGKKVAKVMLR